jgi:membrane protein implicated in regulation of membrane protease activity
MCLCFGLVVFGAVGRLAVPLMVTPWAVVACILALLALSAGAYALLFLFVVKPLKKSNPKAIGQWDLFGEKGKLTLRITRESAGTVSLRDSTGAAISYAARAKESVLEIWEGVIPQGAVVIVTDVDECNKTLYVKPANTMDNMRLKADSQNQ